MNPTRSSPSMRSLTPSSTRTGLSVRFCNRRRFPPGCTPSQPFLSRPLSTSRIYYDKALNPVKVPPETENLVRTEIQSNKKTGSEHRRQDNRRKAKWEKWKASFWLWVAVSSGKDLYREWKRNKAAKAEEKCRLEAMSPEEREEDRRQFHYTYIEYDAQEGGE